MIRPLTRCRLPGHGQDCEVAQERRMDRYPRVTERAMAMRYERTADAGRW